MRLQIKNAFIIRTMEGSNGFWTYLEEELKLTPLSVEKKRFKYSEFNLAFWKRDSEPTYSSADFSVYTYTDGDITFQMVPEDSLCHVFLLPDSAQNQKLVKLCQKMDVTIISGEATVESCNGKALFDALKKILPERNWSYEPLRDISDTESVFSSASDLSRIDVSLLHRNKKEIIVTATFYVTSYERLKVQKLEDLTLVQKVMKALASQGLPTFNLEGGHTFQGV